MPAANDWCLGRVAAPSIGADQYAEIAISSVAGLGAHDGGPCVRINSTTDGDCYLLDLDDGTPDVQLYRADDTGSLGFSAIGAAFGINPNAGDVWKLEISGTTFTVYKGGVSQGTRSDSTLSTGQPGFFANCGATFTNYQFDNFNSGDLGGASTTAPPPWPPAYRLQPLLGR